jgi:hypothetical protein
VGACGRRVRPAAQRGTAARATRGDASRGRRAPAPPAHPSRSSCLPAAHAPVPVYLAHAQVPTEALEHMDLPYPPKVLTDIYFLWGRTVDPLLFLNPMWWQCIEWINLLCLTPFAFAAVYGFWVGADWVRLPAIVISSFTPYSLVLCMGSTMCVMWGGGVWAGTGEGVAAVLLRSPPRLPPHLTLPGVSTLSLPTPLLSPPPARARSFGDVKSAEPSTFLGVYQLYFFFPFLVIARLWRDAPFARRLSPGVESALWAYGSITFAVFFSYVAKWLVVHTPHLLPAPVAAALAAAKALP